MSNYENVISYAKPHTIKKFELIEKYVMTWSQKLLQNPKCNRIVFIDCMCNSGEYVNDETKQRIFGTPIRVAKILHNCSYQYKEKEIDLYFNDIEEDKVNHLKEILVEQKLSPHKNFQLQFAHIDKSDFLKQTFLKLKKNGTHFLLLYDPYDASIDWDSLQPYFDSWGEVIINHMVSDSLRALPNIQTDSAKQKYENTYGHQIRELLQYQDREAFEQCVEELIKKYRKQNKEHPYRIAAFPFFNKRNSIVYYLIHCTPSIAGFKLYKKTAWQVFQGHSSTKNRHGKDSQFIFDFENGLTSTEIDKNCYSVRDIAAYIQKKFCGKSEVPRKDVWESLEKHPVFPSDGFCPQICDILKREYTANVSKQSITFREK